MNVSVGLSRSAIKRAECADDVADVRVIDVAVNDVSDDVIGIFALADFVRRRADFGNVVAFKSAVASSAVIRPPSKTLSKIG